MDAIFSEFCEDCVSLFFWSHPYGPMVTSSLSLHVSPMLSRAVPIGSQILQTGGCQCDLGHGKIMGKFLIYTQILTSTSAQALMKFSKLYDIIWASTAK